MRNKNGQFAKGNSFGKGRPKGSGKKHVKEMTWDALERVVKLLFTMPEKELLQWVKDNQHTLSKAEKVFLQDVHTGDLKHLNSLLDRVVGKPAQALPEANESNDSELDEALEILEAEEMGEVPVEDTPQPQKRKRRRKRRRKKPAKKDSSNGEQ